MYTKSMNSNWSLLSLTGNVDVLLCLRNVKLEPPAKPQSNVFKGPEGATWNHILKLLAKGLALLQ